MYIINRSENEFEAVPNPQPLDNLWLSFYPYSLYIQRTDEGIIIDVYPLDDEMSTAIASTWVFDDELNQQEEKVEVPKEEAPKEEAPKVDADRLGMGVLINMLGGNEDTAKAVQTAIGRTIEGIKMVDERDGALLFYMTDGSVFKVWDDGRSCCESRYMTTDDDLASFVGAELRGFRIADGPRHVGKWGETSEVQFLVVSTSKGEFTVETHNEHNGYYGGFYMKAAQIK